MSQSPFNQNAEMAAMKQNIADRAFNLKVKGMLITGALMLGAFALMFLAPTLLGAATPLVGLALTAGSGIAGLITLKESKKLAMDEQYLQTYMQGKNHWGEGYREEVLEKGWGQRIVTNGPEMGGIPGPVGSAQRGKA